MKIKNLSVLIYIFSLILFLMIINIIISMMILSNYGNLEKEYVENDLKLVVNKLNDELNTLSRTASDWGPWTETAEFVKGNNSNYLSENLQTDTYDNLFINYLVIANTSGNIIYSGSFDLQNKTMVQPASYFTTHLDPNNPLMNMSNRKQLIKGIVILPESPLLVTSQPIVNSDYSGPVSGVLILGKNLDTKEISRLQNLTQKNITIILVNDPSFSPDLLARIRKNVQKESWYIEPINDGQIAGYTLLDDINGNDALILKISESRDIYQQGIQTTFFFIGIILGGGIFFGSIFIIMLNRFVLERMGSIALQVHQIGQLGTTQQRVEILGDDELSGLAFEINRMLDFIEQTQKKLLENEEQIREVVENIPDYVIIYSQKREILYVNPAAVQALGYTADKMIGLPVNFAVAEDYRDFMKKTMDHRQKGDYIPPYEIEIETIEDKRRTVLVKGRNIRYNGKPSTLLLLVDITERKEHEKEREIHTQELERISSSLKQASRQVNLLSSVTRHDILNQVNMGFLFLDSLVLKYKDPELKQKLDNVILVIQTIQHQIEFTRVYEGLGMQEPQWQNLDLILSHLHIPSGISYNANLKGITIYADKMLEKVFFNLLDNSIRHGQGVTEIRLYFKQFSENLVIYYDDNGIGIPNNEKEQIFERGYGKNTGFGLFLVREILSLTDISIHETGIDGMGVRFEISVPNEIFRITDI